MIQAGLCLLDLIAQLKTLHVFGLDPACMQRQEKAHDPISTWYMADWMPPICPSSLYWLSPKKRM